MADAEGLRSLRHHTGPVIAVQELLASAVYRSRSRDSNNATPTCGVVKGLARRMEWNRGQEAGFGR